MSDTTTQIAEDARAEILEALESRASFYYLLATFYNNALTQQQIDEMSELDFASLITENELVDKGFDDIRRYLRKRNTGTRQALATDYTSSFAGVKTFGENTAIPCASLFMDGPKHFFAKQHHVVYGIYKQECIKVAESINLPADHLAFELEFLAMLSQQCIEALEKGDMDTLTHKLEVSKDFITNYILNWFDDFENVALQIIETRFYRGVLRITKGYLQMDLDFISDILDEVNNG